MASQPLNHSTKMSVIIDTDPGVDDTLAILLALASPELEILAFIISFGNTDASACFLNILKIYQAIAKHIEQFPQDAARFPNFMQRRKTILAVGEDKPMEGDIHSAQYFHGRDGLADITQRHPELNVDHCVADHPQLEMTNKHGVDVALDLIRNEPTRSISYIALGPLTNLAKMMRIDRDVMRERIGRVICMGGALDVPGNTNPVSEFNFFADPFAVKELLLPRDPGQALPLDRFLLLPLDITTPHELPFPSYKSAVDPTFDSTASPSRPAGKSPLVHFTSSFLERTRELMCEFGKDAMELHDIAAMWCALANPLGHPEPPPSHDVGREAGAENTACELAFVLQDGWKATRRKFDIERYGELTRGMLVVDRREDEGAYAPGVNRAQVQAELDRHHFEHAGAYESTALPAQVEIERPPSPRTQRPPPPAPADPRPAVDPDSEQKQEKKERTKRDVVVVAAPADERGVPCVTATPGPAALLRLLLERVWGVKE